MRAVAAISLGRTGHCEEFIIDALINLLKDNDRIVRQSACLSLGTLKAVKAIPAIGNIWYVWQLRVVFLFVISYIRYINTDYVQVQCHVTYLGHQAYYFLVSQAVLV